MSVVFYKFYKFYKNILKEDSPIWTTVFVISFSQSIIVNTILNLMMALLYGLDLSKWGMLFVFGIVFIINIIHFIFYGYAEKIILAKPLFINEVLSVLVSVLSFILAISCMFIDPLLKKAILFH